jgi:mono/diheme cytochrome c family protein
MRKVVKSIGIALGGFFGLLVAAVIGVYLLSEARFNRLYIFEVEPVAIQTDPESVAYGEHIARIRGCKACHGEDLSGQIEFEDPLVGVIANANLTGGPGSEVVDYEIEDWVRSIRNGVGPDGKPLIIMPSHQHYVMSDGDLGALLGYIFSLPPVGNELPDMRLNLFPRALFLAGQVDLLVPAELIDHAADRPAAPERGPTADYGQYLSGLCSLCHGPGFSGGPMPLSAPDEPPALNLTPGGELAFWKLDDFITAIRTGVTPSGHILDDDYMPWDTIFRHMTDEELEAIWLYLQSLPPREFGNR